MKKKYVFGLSALIVLVLSTVIFIACQKSEVMKMNSVMMLSSSEKLEVEKLFPLTGEMGIFPSPEKMNTFRNLNEEQLDYFIALQAKERVIPIDGLQPENGLSYEDMVMLFDKQAHAVDALGVKLLNKRYNELSEDDIKMFFRDYVYDIIDLMKSDNNPTSLANFLENYQKEVMSEIRGGVSPQNAFTVY